jgi:hypothetical protein
VRRIPISELPATSEGLGTWLRTRFEEKDRLLEDFFSTGEFAVSGAHRPVVVPQSLVSFEAGPELVPEA